MIIKHLVIHAQDVSTWAKGEGNYYNRGRLAIVTDDCHPTIRKLAHEHNFYGFLTESEYNAQPITEFEIKGKRYLVSYVSEEHPKILKHFESCCEENLEWWDGDYETERYVCEQCNMEWEVYCEFERHWNDVRTADYQSYTHEDGTEVSCNPWMLMQRYKNKLVQKELF